MPRTKQVRKKSSAVKRANQYRASGGSMMVPTSSCDSNAVAILMTQDYESPKDFLEKFDTFYNAKLEEHKLHYEQNCERVKEIFRNLLDGIPDSAKSMRINDYSEQYGVEDQNKDPNSTRIPKVRQSRHQQSVESFEFAKPKTPRVGRSRESSQKRSLSAPRLVSGFKTPMMSNRKLPPGGTVTPKFCSDTPMYMMRRPVHGEIAISMSGSPLMVGAVSSEEIPTVNVPLQDGRIISIMPEEGQPLPDFPGLDDQTKLYLKTLRAHLAILAPNSP